MYFLLLALLILIPGLIFVPIRWPMSVQNTFSQHVAPRQSSINYYRALFIVVLPILYAFFATYFVPKFRLPSTVLWLVGVSAVAQIGCTLIPETGGRKTTIHVGLAGISALLLLGVLAVLLKSLYVSPLDKWVTCIAIAIMSAIILIVGIWRNAKLPGLILQSAYFAAFFITLLFVTF